MGLPFIATPLLNLSEWSKTLLVTFQGRFTNFLPKKLKQRSNFTRRRYEGWIPTCFSYQCTSIDTETMQKISSIIQTVSTRRSSFQFFRDLNNNGLKIWSIVKSVFFFPFVCPLRSLHPPPSKPHQNCRVHYYYKNKCITKVGITQIVQTAENSEIIESKISLSHP